MAFLYEKIDALREYGSCAPVPDYIPQNLNPNFELRPYQRKAFENFITHFESRKCPKPTQVLFHMATGSGKTLMMAGLMLYLYQKGYRNFLFFVNLSNIVEKTRENFTNPASSKYLFAQDVVLEGCRVPHPAGGEFPGCQSGCHQPLLYHHPRDFMRICGRPRKMPCPLRISRPIKPS